MPSTVTSLFEAAGLEQAGAVRWGTTVPISAPGIYIVAMTADPQSLSGTLPDPPLDQKAFRYLLEVRRELLLDGMRPTFGELEARVARFWLPDEPILYVGLAGTSLRDRVNQYYTTKLGKRAPHAGGFFLKFLTNLQALTVHFARALHPTAAEAKALRSFVSHVSEDTRSQLFDPARPFPFANLRGPDGERKRHGISGAKESRTRRKAGRPGRVEQQPRRGRTVTSRRNIEVINQFLQAELRRRGLSEVPAVEAGRWLDEGGLLEDSAQRPGLPLRNLLRAGVIAGQRQEPNSRWLIDRIH